MREIKFRAYDKEAGEMIYSDQEYDNYFFEFKDGSLRAFVIKENAGTLHEPPQVYSEELDDLDEYTGLKDKNGEEIYENDITELLAEDGKKNRFIVKYGIAERVMASGWTVDIPSFYFDLIGGNFKAFPIVLNYKGIHDLEMTKIIGNKHENPELLKE